MKFKRLLHIVIMFACLGTSSGCYYYKARGRNLDTAGTGRSYRTLKHSLNRDRYVIIHQGDSMWRLDYMGIDLPRKRKFSTHAELLSGSLGPVDTMYAVYYNRLRAKKRRARRYPLVDEGYALTQSHVYIANGFPIDKDQVSIPSSAITRVERYQQASGRTYFSWLFVNIMIDMIFNTHVHKDKPARHEAHQSPHRTSSPRTH